MRSRDGKKGNRAGHLVTRPSMLHERSDGGIRTFQEGNVALSRAILLVLFGCICMVNASEIRLKNGQHATVPILDTSGCEVTIRRRGTPVRIKKALIKHIVMESDTIDYSGYECAAGRATEAPKVDFVAFSPERIAALLEALPMRERAVAGRTVSVNQRPLLASGTTRSADSAVEWFLDTLTALYSCEIIPDSLMASMLGGNRTGKGVLIVLLDLAQGHFDGRKVVGEMTKRRVFTSMTEADAFRNPLRRGFRLNRKLRATETVVRLVVVDPEARQCIADFSVNGIEGALHPMAPSSKEESEAAKQRTSAYTSTVDAFHKALRKLKRIVRQPGE